MLWGIGSPAPALIRRGGVLAPVFDFVGQAVGGSAALAIPTHAAPVDGIHHVGVFVSANNVTDIGEGTPPPVLTVAGAPCEFIAGRDQTGSTFRMAITFGVHAFAAPGETVTAFGTGVTRTAVAVFRIRPLPASLLDLFRNAGVVNVSWAENVGTPSANVVWPTLTLPARAAGLESRVIGCGMTGAITSTGDNTGPTLLTAANYDKFSAGVGGFGTTGRRTTAPGETAVQLNTTRSITGYLEVRDPGGIA